MALRVRLRIEKNISLYIVSKKNQGRFYQKFWNAIYEEDVKYTQLQEEEFNLWLKNNITKKKYDLDRDPELEPFKYGDYEME